MSLEDPGQPTADASGVSLENPGLPPAPGTASFNASPSPEAPQSCRLRRFLLRGGVPLLALLLVGIGALALSVRQEQSSGTEHFGDMSIPLEDLRSGEDAYDFGRRVAINGLLQVAGSLILLPGDTPDTPTEGQIYYDRQKHQLGYYNGNEFVYMHQEENVASLGGVAGDIALGSGLQLVNGTLTVTQNEPDANTTYAAGEGLSLAGTVFRLDIAGTPNQVAVTDGAGNTVSFSLPQDIAPASSPTFRGLLLSDGASTGALQLGSLTANRTYTLPDAGGIVCLTSGNCANAGGGITGTGTAGFLPVFTDADSIADSIVFSDGTNLGIGTTNPQSTLHLSGADDVRLLLEADTDDSGEGDNPAIVLQQDGGTRSLTIGIEGVGGTAFAGSETNSAYIASSDEDIQFATSGVARLTIESDGVGIGTSEPDAMLHVNGQVQFNDGAAVNEEVVINEANDGSSDTGLVLQHAGGQAFILYSNSDGTFDIADGSETPYLRIDGASGNVGIGTGTTTPSAKLDIVAPAGTWSNSDGGQLKLSTPDTVGAALTLNATDTGGHQYSLLSTGSSAIGGAGGLQIYDSTTGDVPLRIDGNGNVGIGTTDPEALLHLAHTGDARLILAADTDNSGEGDNPAIVLQQDGGTNHFAIGIEGNTAGTSFAGSLVNASYAGTAGPNALQLVTNSTARLTIDASGEIGIGTNNPVGTLHLYGDGSLGAGAVLYMGDNYAGGTQNIYMAELGFGSGTDSDILELHGKKGIQLTYGSSAGQAGLVLDAGGQVGIGTVNPQYALDVAGNVNLSEGLYTGGTLRIDNQGNYYVAGQFSFKYGGAVFDEAQKLLYVTRGDELRFKTPSVVEQFDGTSWVSYSNDFGPITDAKATAVNVPDTISQFRLTYDSVDAYLKPYALIQQGYNQDVFDLKVERSTDGGSTWQTLTTATGLTDSQSVVNIGRIGAATHLRFTFTVTSYSDTEFSLVNLMLLSYRPDSQGGTFGTLMPYSYDYRQNIAFGADVDTANRLTVQASSDNANVAALLDASGNTVAVFGEDGQVGIGTSTPGKPLEIVAPAGTWGNVSGGQLKVTSPDSTGAALTLNSTDTGGHMYSLISTGSVAFGGAGGLMVYDSTADEVRLRIDGDGDVGIGTYNPGGDLHLVDEGGLGYIELLGSNDFEYDGGTNGVFQFEHEGPSSGYTIIGADGDDLVITNDDQVGIGTDTPGATLDVNGDTLITGSDVGPSSGALTIVTSGETMHLGGNELDTTHSDGLFIMHNSPYDLNLVTGGGNVGIGMGLGAVDPEEKLSVAGTGQFGSLYTEGDTLVDADGSASTSVGTADAITDGDALVAVETADNLCADSLTAPAAVFTDSGGDCDVDDTDIHTVLLGTLPAGDGTTAADTPAVDASWAFLDNGVTTGAYDDGEDLYIDSFHALAYNSGRILQAGSQVCDTSGNCSGIYQTAGDYFQLDGNSFGGLATLGTNDNFGLAFETNGTTRLTIEASGNVHIGPSNIILYGSSGNADFTGVVTADSLNVTQGLTLNGHIIGNADTRGQITVPAGTTSATYTFNSAYASPPIVTLTPTGTPQSFGYSVSDVTTTGFTVSLTAAQTSDTTFNFHAQQ